MTSIDQERVKNCARARTVEPHAVASWPARETLSLDGWLLRFSNGYSGRANSVATHAFWGSDLVHSVVRVEAAYQKRGRPCQFQITPATLPADLCELLKVRGYRPEPCSVVMIAETVSIAENLERLQRLDVKTEVGEPAMSTFAQLTREGSRSDGDGDERLAVLRRIAHPKFCVVLMSNGAAVSSGACVSTGEWAGIYVMRTAVQQRRRGHALRVLCEAARWALAQGSPRLYLQVDEANLAARGLYARAGFRDGYRYRNFRLT